jgi:tetratricopeptide (TPR) repeat protein
MRGEILLELERPQEALNDFKLAAINQIVPEAATQAGLALACVQLGRPDDARRIWDRLRSTETTLSCAELAESLGWSPVLQTQMQALSALVDEPPQE